jgi:hypothetical protein
LVMRCYLCGRNVPQHKVLSQEIKSYWSWFSGKPAKTHTIHTHVYIHIYVYTYIYTCICRYVTVSMEWFRGYPEVPLCLIQGCLAAGCTGMRELTVKICMNFVSCW